MSRAYVKPIMWLVLSLAVTATATAQRSGPARRAPNVGYVCPAGGRVGSVLKVTVGGQYLDRVTEVVVSGSGLRATVVGHNKPMPQKRVNQLREKLEQARKKLQAEGKKVNPFGGRGKRGDVAALIKIAQTMGVSAEDVQAFIEYRQRRADPKRQLNPQLAETVTLEVTIDRDAALGQYELRLKTATQLSNPLRFYAGQWPEVCEATSAEIPVVTRVDGPLPAVLNGQILPGQADRFRFQAQRGERLVIAAQARQLIPYLADAVPGWFQATLALYDATGQEVAFDDDFQFHPDPVLYYEVPADGHYDLEIKDAIYRGREDFVYRITLGQLPFVTSIFPLGGRRGHPSRVSVSGRNVTRDQVTLDTAHLPPGIHQVAVAHRDGSVSFVPFAIDTLPEQFEQEPNDARTTAQRIDWPVILNGRVDQAGDRDVFQFEGEAGATVVLEVAARRLDSPIDSFLQVTDASGGQLGSNDDVEDPAAGLVTHHADSKLRITLPSTGTYFVCLGDTQHHGGSHYGYRLRVSSPQPDFQLRVVPSTINARGGITLPIAVHALREDGFDGEIALRLKDPPDGFRLAGAWVPSGQDRVWVTLAIPPTFGTAPARLELEGRAVIDGRDVRHAATAADDMLQAFIYRHLVPAKGWYVAVAGRPPPPRRSGGVRARRGRRGAVPVRAGLERFEVEPLQIPLGGTARIELPASMRFRAGNVDFELSDPPPGITIEKTSSDKGSAAILVRAAASHAQPGVAGNLIVRAFVERTSQRGSGKKPVTRRSSVGTLPAIRFEIVPAAG